ncbi:MAG: hypothetical protein HYZ89_01090 [Candidatus Omnitrophica bacterium]|nr:hypothetical protein [Candidatus Omnitrophota bacterium]
MKIGSPGAQTKPPGVGPQPTLPHQRGGQGLVSRPVSQACQLMHSPAALLSQRGSAIRAKLSSVILGLMEKQMVRFVAHFDGKHLLPDVPVELPTGKPLQVTVEELPVEEQLPPLNLAEWLNQIEAECGLVDGPEDWAAQHDHYLYGAPKEDVSDGN